MGAKNQELKNQILTNLQELAILFKILQHRRKKKNVAQQHISGTRKNEGTDMAVISVCILNMSGSLLSSERKAQLRQEGKGLSSQKM